MADNENVKGPQLLSDEELEKVAGGHSYWSRGYEDYYTRMYNLNHDNGWIPSDMTYDDFLIANCPGDLPARELYLKDPKHAFSIDDNGNVTTLSGVIGGR